MPEGPSILILREALMPFKGKKVTEAKGYSALDFDKVVGQTIRDLKSWGKHLLICFKGFFIRIHLMMFGTYRINEQKPSNPALHLGFGGDKEINFYTCKASLVEQDVNEVYDWETDILSEHWNAKKAEAALKEAPELKLCDALLDQNIFSGSGNIIKNEALFNARLHPASVAGATPLRKLRELIRKTVEYGHDFYTWKQAGTLAKHWHVYEQSTCPRCKIPLEKEYLGKGKRITFFCTNCQTLFKHH